MFPEELTFDSPILLNGNSNDGNNTEKIVSSIAYVIRTRRCNKHGSLCCLFAVGWLQLYTEGKIWVQLTQFQTFCATNTDSNLVKVGQYDL